MPPPSDQPSGEPRLYFLNERHQLVPASRDGGGRPKTILNIDWASHGAGLKDRLFTLRAAREQSADPTGRKRAFLLAASPDELQRSSTSKKAEGGKLRQPVRLAGTGANVIERLGFDLLAVREDGSAIVHAIADRLEQMIHSLDHLMAVLHDHATPITLEIKDIHLVSNVFFALGRKKALGAAAGRAVDELG